MTHKILILPNIERREISGIDNTGRPIIIQKGNVLKIFDLIDKIPAIKIEKGHRDQQKTKATRCQKNGVFEEDVRNGQYIPIEGELIQFEIHPDSGITQEDIDTLPEDTNFGNGMSTFAINGKRCMIVVLQADAIVTPSLIPASIINSMKSKDELP